MITESTAVLPFSFLSEESTFSEIKKTTSAFLHSNVLQFVQLWIKKVKSGVK